MRRLSNQPAFTLQFAAHERDTLLIELSQVQKYFDSLPDSPVQLPHTKVLISFLKGSGRNVVK